MGIIMWVDLPKENVTMIARRKLEEFGLPQRVNLDGADGILAANSIGRIIAIPPETNPINSIQDLNDGAIIGLLSVEYSEIFKSGIYQVKMFKDNGTWITQLISGEEVIYSTIEVKVVEVPGNIEKPSVSILGVNPVVIIIVIGGAELAKGIAIAAVFAAGVYAGSKL